MHNHIRIYTKSGSIYLICQTESKWIRTKAGSDEFEHLNFEGDWASDYNPEIGDKLVLERYEGSYTDKYNPKIITTTAIVDIKLC